MSRDTRSLVSAEEELRCQVDELRSALAAKDRENARLKAEANSSNAALEKQVKLTSVMEDALAQTDVRFLGLREEITNLRAGIARLKTQLAQKHPTATQSVAPPPYECNSSTTAPAASRTQASRPTMWAEKRTAPNARPTNDAASFPSLPTMWK